MGKYKEYVLGFAFSRNGKEVVLIEKQKPDWQKGKINGIGGKIEADDVNQLHAMIREFREETGVDTSSEQWNEFGCMTFENDITGVPCKIYLFRMFDDCIHECFTNESEEIIKVNSDTVLDVYNCMHNLPILIPLALSKEFKYTELKD